MNRALLTFLFFAAACGGSSLPCPPNNEPACQHATKATCSNGEWQCEPCNVDFAGLSNREICGAPDAAYVQAACGCIFDE